jgi:microcystin degradation protein MlrC
MKRVRIAIGQISSESNHFAGRLCEVDFFRATGYWLEGREVFNLTASDTEVGGMLQACRVERDVDVAPLLATRANSSSVLSDKCWSYLKRRMLRRLKAAGKVDGVAISHHGSMAVENEDDPEGDLAVEIRRIIGPRTPFAMTLDLHGNVTRRMVEATNIICGYETYPHQDAHRTGQRATAMLLRTIRGEIRPVMAHVKLPMLLTAFHGSTFGKGGFARLMRAAKSSERQRDVLSTSLFFVGSYLDMPDMGCSTLVIADGDAKLATRHATSLAKSFWANREEFSVETMSATEAVKRGRRIEGGPVLLLDTADTTGGGAAGDSIALVKGLLDADVTEPCLAMVVDPVAARRCHTAKIGTKLRLSIGHRVDPKWGKPLTVTAKLLRKTDGRFRYSGGIFGGTTASMGRSAVLQIGGIQLLVMTHPTYDYAREQYESAGLDPRRAKFVGVKNMMNFRFGYRDIMKGCFVLDCPGPTPMDMRAQPFGRVKRPIFPLDEIKNSRLTLTVSKS